MKINKYKAIVSDIDGTLVPIIPHALPSQKVTKKIKELREKGIIFSLASGRPYYLLEYLEKHLSLDTPTIADNGAVIVDAKNGSVLWERNLANEEAREIVSMVKKNTLIRLSCDSCNLENPKSIPGNIKVRKISVHDMTHEVADKLVKEVENKFKNLAIVKAASYKGNDLTDVYFSNVEATKQHALLVYAKLLGISPKEIIGVGDGYNDFPLLMACGLKVAMGNAVNELKAIADYIAPSQDEDGIIDVIDKFINK